MTFRKLRRSWIQWTCLGIGGFAIGAAIMLAFIAVIAAVAEGVGNRNRASRNTVEIYEAYQLPLDVSLSDSESLSDCTLTIESIDENCIVIFCKYAISTIDNYELDFNQVYHNNEYTYASVDYKEIDFNSIYQLPAGNHIICYELKYDVNYTYRYRYPNIVYISLASRVNGKSVNMSVTMSDDVSKDYYVVSKDTFSYKIQKNGFELKDNKTPTSTILLRISLGFLCYLASLAIFEIVCAIGVKIEKKEEKKELYKKIQEIQDSEDQTLDI